MLRIRYCMFLLFYYHIFIPIRQAIVITGQNLFIIQNSNKEGEAKMFNEHIKAIVKLYMTMP